MPSIPVMRNDTAELKFQPDPSARDWLGPLTYYSSQDLPKGTVSSAFGEWSDVVVGAKRNSEAYASFELAVVDARTHLSGGKEAWHFEEHGFMFLPRPAPDYTFVEHADQDRKDVDAKFGPAVCEAVRQATGATKAFWMSHQRRAEKSVRTRVEGYATGGTHSDYGPDFEPQFRTVLEKRYGMSHEEAQTCGLCLVNLWCPVNRPAFRNPLALLDSSTVNMDTDVIKWKLRNDFDNGYSYSNVEKSGAQKHRRPLDERVPQAAKDAPALAPVFNPNHRWVFLSDMAEDECVVFKQYDFRPSAKAKATFHCSFPDPHHREWKDCPGRRSAECRVILTFPPDDGAKARL